MMTVEGADWYVKRYESLGRLMNAVNPWIEKWQFKLKLKINDNIVSYGKCLDELIPIQRIKDECNVISDKIKLGRNTEDKSTLGEDIELKQVNVVKMKDLMIEKERKECEIIMEKILDELSHLKENFENRRIEMEKNINTFDEINLIVEQLKSSMNFETVQGYGKKNGKQEEREREREFQVIVSKGIELLNELIDNKQYDYLQQNIKNFRNNNSISNNCMMMSPEQSGINGSNFYGSYYKLLQNVKLLICGLDGNINENDSEYGIHDWNSKGKFIFSCDIGNNYVTSKVGFFIMDDGG